MDETTLNELDKDINNKNAVEDRIRNLHKDKKEAEDKFASESKARIEAESKMASMEKETNFLNSFSDSIAKYPDAGQFKDKIKEKFNAGYSLEDATITTLVAEGKFTPQAPKVERENSMGGSASNQITNNYKAPSDMKQAERLEGLREAEKRGDLYMS